MYNVQGKAIEPRAHVLTPNMYCTVYSMLNTEKKGMKSTVSTIEIFVDSDTVDVYILNVHHSHPVDIGSSFPL